MPGCDERSPAAGWAAVPPSLHALQGPGSLSTWQGPHPSSRTWAPPNRANKCNQETRTNLI